MQLFVISWRRVHAGVDEEGALTALCGWPPHGLSVSRPHLLENRQSFLSHIYKYVYTNIYNVPYIFIFIMISSHFNFQSSQLYIAHLVIKYIFFYSNSLLMIRIQPQIKHWISNPHLYFAYNSSFLNPVLARYLFLSITDGWNCSQQLHYYSIKTNDLNFDKVY